MKGRFVTLEGGEGAGKTTQGGRLAAALCARGLPVMRTREPGGSFRAEALRSFILSQGGWDPLAEMALHFAARREHWSRLIRPALEAGITVICDRFHDSTFAYQVAGQGGDAGAFEALRHALVPDAVPDATILLDIPPQAGLSRARDANRYEAMGPEFHARVREGFLRRASAEPDRIAVLDATRPQAEVTEAALRRVLHGA
ncbi:dTMP kinase [Sabulicella glaciei]|uniref:Thymidylate kinase n=1 Tax=Sabulicella glaciei TaxID=2984948 RepID=A0ABT3NR38_9PROT|nr:dTMP kinase [Roseococcus sp. MDT2-1-1]MCW8084625.1 dTMP kinase [Roseococcus sp. MDT2-1-1]